MTRDADFKQRVRDRMRATGQNFTAARADLLASGVPDPVVAPGDAVAPMRGTAPGLPVSAPMADEAQRALAEHQDVVHRFVKAGRLVNVPAKRKARVHVLLDLVALFAPGEQLPEKAVNERLRTVVEDHAFWRRELVDYGYLQREAGVYWLTATPPERGPAWEQELPAWERVWLPAHLAGRAGAGA